MKIQDINGIGHSDLSAIDGTTEWYQFTEFARPYSGEPVDYEDIVESYREGKDYSGKIIGMIHYPDMKIHRPVELRKNVLCGEACHYSEGAFYFNQVLLEQMVIQFIKYVPGNTPEVLTRIPVNTLDDPDMLPVIIQGSPVSLVQANDEEIIFYYPEQVKVKCEDAFGLFLRDGDVLYVDSFEEDDDDECVNYLTKVSFPDGKVISREEGNMAEMPDGSYWKF